MEAKQIKLANELLQTASERLEHVSGDIPAFNLLSALQMERLETRTHSRILFYLLSDNAGKDFPALRKRKNFSRGFTESGWKK